VIRLFDRALGPVAKAHRDGTHRAVAPARTIARFRRLMKTCGITRLANLTGLDSLGVPVWSAIRPNGRSLSTSQGKGLTDDHARASALMESIETWHAEHIELPRRRAPGSARVDVRGLARVRPLPRGASFEWVEGWDLVSSSAIWVPYEAVTLDTVFASPPVFDVSSNGLASGNHVLEAIVHGLTEVIERDAEASWRAEKGDRRVDLASVTGPAAALIARLRAHGVFVAIWDLTSDIGIPVYGCAILEDPREPAWRALGLYQGFGCHLDPEVAVIRAVTEAVQTRVTYIAGSRDDFFPFDYDRATDEEILHGIWADLTRPRRRWVDLRRAPRLARETFEDDLRVVVDRLVAAGCSRVVVVDLTRAELGVPVVKCLVPGRAKRVHLMG
jgi:YcaO-like protein with predicted kinase domain